MECRPAPLPGRPGCRPVLMITVRDSSLVDHDDARLAKMITSLRGAAGAELTLTRPTPERRASST